MESVPTSVINPEGLRSKSPGDLLRISAPTFCLRSGKRGLKGSQEVHDPGFRDGRRRETVVTRRITTIITLARILWPPRYAPGSAKSALSLCSPRERERERETVVNSRFPRCSLSEDCVMVGGIVGKKIGIIGNYWNMEGKCGKGNLWILIFYRYIQLFKLL